MFKFSIDFKATSNKVKLNLLASYREVNIEILEVELQIRETELFISE